MFSEAPAKDRRTGSAAVDWLSQEGLMTPREHRVLVWIVAETQVAGAPVDVSRTAINSVSLTAQELQDSLERLHVLKLILPKSLAT